MSRIATCGNCQERVTIPEGLEEGESVRCPLCQAVYSLSEVPAEATDADDDSEIPPELVPVAEVSEEGQESESSRGEPEASEHQAVETAEANGQPEESPDAEAEAGVEPGEEGPSAETETGAEAEEEEEADEEGENEDEAVGVGEKDEEAVEEAAEAAEATTETGVELSEAEAPDETVQVRCPHCDAEYPLSRVIVVTTGAELGPAMAAAVARYVLPGEGPAGEAPALDVWAKADGVPQIDLGEGAKPQAVTAHAGAFDFAREDAEAEAGPASLAARRPRRRQQKSMARELAGWVFGGVAGLVIAYYLLNFIRGEAGNFLKFPLPGVSHTYRYSPDWFPGWMKAAPESEDAESDEIADLDQLYRPAQPDGKRADAEIAKGEAGKATVSPRIVAERFVAALKATDLEALLDTVSEDAQKGKVARQLEVLKHPIGAFMLGEGHAILSCNIRRNEALVTVERDGEGRKPLEVHCIKVEKHWKVGRVRFPSDSQLSHTVEISFVSDSREEKLTDEQEEALSSSGVGSAVPPPEHRTFPDGYVGLATPPSYTSDELGEALKATHESVGEEAEPISEEAYGKWCRLAEVVTFAQGGPGAGQLRDRKSAVRTLLETIGKSEANLDKIGLHAGTQCVARNRPSNGILLAGKVTNIASEGNAHGAHVELAASGRTILVAGKRPLPAKEGESVLILGRIVDDPAENLIGFKTQQPLVVWAGLTVKVEP